ncbi:MAG: ferritin family protein [Bacillota bacterium]
MYQKELTRREIIEMKRHIHIQLSRAEIEALTRNIYYYIEEELEAAAYYQDLSDLAPDPQAKQILLEFSHDERIHANQFQQIYEALSSREYSSPGEIDYNFEINNYINSLESRMLEETADFKKYKNTYLSVNDNTFRDIFFNAMHDEAHHAMRILYLIHMEMMREMMARNKENKNNILDEVNNMMKNIIDTQKNISDTEVNIKTKNTGK